MAISKCYCISKRVSTVHELVSEEAVQRLELGCTSALL